MSKSASSTKEQCSASERIAQYHEYGENEGRGQTPAVAAQKGFQETNRILVRNMLRQALTWNQPHDGWHQPGVSRLTHFLLAASANIAIFARSYCLLVTHECQGHSDILPICPNYTVRSHAYTQGRVRKQPHKFSSGVRRVEARRRGPR